MNDNVIPFSPKRPQCIMCMGAKAYNVEGPLGLQTIDPCDRCGGTGEEPDKFTTTFDEMTCKHEWVEGVDEEGELIEPAYDVCIHCGEERR